MPVARFNASEFLAHCTSLPGVYRMQDAAGQLLYVGKANNLKKRLASYFRSSGLSPKTKALVSQIALIETTITSNETEALLLEQNLIKQWHPPYNILLRDDKSYPYLYLSDGIYPGLYLHRGSKKKPGRYFGPYPNSSAVRDSLKLLQKTFRVRQCEDTQFQNRSRPCLQHQIQRCKAPCVGLVSAPEYAQDVHHSVLFLEGHNNRLTDELSQQMELQAQQLNFEKAAEIRDQIGQLRHLQNLQGMESRSENADILAIALESGLACINLVYIRGGRMLGDRNIFIQPQMDETAPEVLQAFLEQHYLNQTEFELPNELVVPPQTLEDPSPLLAAIKNTRGKSLRLSSQVRGIRNHWLQQAQTNATQSLHSKLRSQQQLEARFTALTQALQLPEPAQRLECFDISHHQGEATVAACVAFSPSGPIKSDYRCYNIENVTSGDDYAAMQAALIKRFSKAEHRLPDLLLIDGGKGQLNAVKETLAQLNLTHLKLLGIAKGVTRKPGLETLYLDDIQNEFTLPSDDPALHLIQQVRDEAHRFAITGNRTRLNKKRKGSTLEQIPAVGPKRRQALLKHFGGLQALKNASISEIARVPGISSNLASTIYAALHTE